MFVMLVCPVLPLFVISRFSSTDSIVPFCVWLEKKLPRL